MGMPKCLHPYQNGGLCEEELKSSVELECQSMSVKRRADDGDVVC